MHTLANGDGRVVHPDQVSSVERGEFEKSDCKSGVSSGEIGGGKGVLLAHRLIGALLVVSGNVAVRQLVAFQALVTGAVRALENREREARQCTHVNFIGGANEVVVCDVRKPQNQSSCVSLPTVARKRAMVWSARSTPPCLAAGMDGARDHFVYPRKGIHFLRELRHELAAILREAFHNRDIGRAFHGKFRGGDGVHVGAAAEVVGEKEGTQNSQH